MRIFLHDSVEKNLLFFLRMLNLNELMNVQRKFDKLSSLIYSLTTTENIYQLHSVLELLKWIRLWNIMKTCLRKLVKL
ncbi:hypothetical protein C2G38_2114385 [Gigaspora rosea]|uniref:Uncharacterized protein n=1 Tax=Gigaspora rosea TaxID=44941 RepID=A0A397UAD3_9GLOM|nr:hypothetical protein C2G38_2114385 [Gigaspora rosea]